MGAPRSRPPLLRAAVHFGRFRKDFLDFTEQRLDFHQRRRDQFSGHVTFVGEINSGFDQGGRLDDPLAPVPHPVAEQTFQLAQRLAALPIGVGMDQIVETFGLDEIELAVLECAPGEFSRLGRTDISAKPESAANNAASTARPP